MKRILAILLSASVLLALLLPWTGSAEGEREILTIGETTKRSSTRMSGF